MMPEIRPATTADLAELFGATPALSARAFVGVIDGRVVGAGGIFYDRAYTPIAFCTLKPEARAYNVLICRVALRVLALAREAGISRLYAICDGTEPGAAKWLQRLGFISGPTGPKGTVYEWRTR